MTRRKPASGESHNENTDFDARYGDHGV